MSAPMAAAIVVGGPVPVASTLVPPVVSHLHGDVGIVEVEANLDRRRRFRVFESIGERLLHQPVDRQLRRRGQLEWPAGLFDLHLQTGRPHAVDERLEVGQSRLRRIRCPRVARLGMPGRPGSEPFEPSPAGIPADGRPVAGRSDAPLPVTVRSETGSLPWAASP